MSMRIEANPEEHDVPGLPRRGEVVAAGAGVGAVFLMLPWTEAGFAAAWWLLALVVIRSDVSHFLIPDWTSAAIAGLGLIHAALPGLAAGSGFEPVVSRLAEAVGNGMIAFALLWAIGAAYRRLTQRCGLGFGDVKLAGASALWLDAAGFSACLQLAALAALALVLLKARRKKADALDLIPFGAFLAPAAWLVHVVSLSSMDASDLDLP
jgi:prepilin signal peptidase PulO-like enzyme (type II secretory pathway)